MSNITIISATGKLGGLTGDALIRRGVDPGEITAAGRNTERLADHAASGVRPAAIDLDDPSTLVAALDDSRALLLVSVPGNPRRVDQHRNAIEAAEAAGVPLIAYTSFAHADTTASSSRRTTRPPSRCSTSGTSTT